MLMLELLELLAAIKSGRWPNDGGVLHRRGADAGRARVKQESRTSTNCSGLLLSLQLLLKLKLLLLLLLLRHVKRLAGAEGTRPQG
jgi:hypothetical protein